MLSLLLIAACQDAETLQVEGPQHGTPPRTEVGVDSQAGEKHPPIPGDNPGWKNITAEFKRAPMAYGEERWDDVTMRVLGHYAQASRDLARLQVQKGELPLAKSIYSKLAERLNQLELGEAGQSRQIRQLHVQAAQSHADVIALRLSETGSTAEGLGPNATDRWRVASGMTPLQPAICLLCGTLVCAASELPLFGSPCLSPIHPSITAYAKRCAGAYRRSR